jgi:sulfur dioxygenase
LSNNDKAPSLDIILPAFLHLVNTHVHADHITGSGLIKKQTNYEVKSILSKDTNGLADIHVVHG